MEKVTDSCLELGCNRCCRNMVIMGTKAEFIDYCGADLNPLIVEGDYSYALEFAKVTEAIVSDNSKLRQLPLKFLKYQPILEEFLSDTKPIIVGYVPKVLFVNDVFISNDGNIVGWFIIGNCNFYNRGCIIFGSERRPKACANFGFQSAACLDLINTIPSNL